MDLLPKLFIKDYKNYDNQNVRLKYGKMCGSVGIITNIFVCLIKIVVGLIIGSIAIIADGINNLADAGSSILTLVGFKLASKPSDNEHPFGHERMEYITGLIVSLVIIAIGILLFSTSIDKILQKEIISYDGIIAYVTIGILVLSILIKCWQCLFYRKYGKLINSTTLIATSTDSLNDCISTGAVLIATIIALFYPNAYLDGVMGILVSLFIVFGGSKLVKETISPLIGEVPSKEFINDVKSKILAYSGVLGLHDLVVHSYGAKRIFITVHVEVDSKKNINDSHDMIDNIESDFRNNENINIVIHMDPIDIVDEVVVTIRSKVSEILPTISKDLLFHDLRVVKGQTHTNVIFDIVRPFDFKLTEQEILDIMNKKLKEYNPTLNCVITFDLDFTGGHIYD